MNMSEILTILVCGCIPLLLGGFVIVWGSRTRFRLGNRMFRDIANGQSKTWTRERNYKKISILLTIALISLIGVLMMVGTVVIFHVPLPEPLQKLFVFLLLVCLITSVVIGREMFRPIDKRS